MDDTDDARDTETEIARAGSAPACGCRLVSYLVPRYTYHCAVGDETRVYVVEATSIPSADPQVCSRFNDESDTDYTILDPTPDLGGCLPAGTPVWLGDGTTAPIETLGPGTPLLAGRIGAPGLAVRPLEGAGYGRAALLALELEGGGVLRCSADQGVMTTYGPVRAGWLQPGATLLAPDIAPDGAADGADGAVAVAAGPRVAAVTATEAAGPVVSLFLGADWYFLAGARPLAWKCKGPYDDRGTPL